MFNLQLTTRCQFYQGLADQVKQEMNSGNSGVECFAARLWEQQEKLGLDDEELAYSKAHNVRNGHTLTNIVVAGSAFEAGTDTTAGTMLPQGHQNDKTLTKRLPRAAPSQPKTSPAPTLSSVPSA